MKKRLLVFMMGIGVVPSVVLAAAKGRSVQPDDEAKATEFDEWCEQLPQSRREEYGCGRLDLICAAYRKEQQAKREAAVVERPSRSVVSGAVARSEQGPIGDIGVTGVTGATGSTGAKDAAEAVVEQPAGGDRPLLLTEWLERYSEKLHPEYYQVEPTHEARQEYAIYLRSRLHFEDWLKQYPAQSHPHYYKKAPAARVYKIYRDYLKSRIISFERWLIQNPSYLGDMNKAKREYDFHAEGALEFLNRGGEWPQTPEDRARVKAVEMFKPDGDPQLIKMPAQALPRHRVAKPVVVCMSFEEWLQQYPQATNPDYYVSYYGGQMGQKLCVDLSPKARTAYKEYLGECQVVQNILSFEEWLLQNPANYRQILVRRNGEYYMQPTDSAQQVYDIYAVHEMIRNTEILKKYYQ